METIPYILLGMMNRIPAMKFIEHILFFLIFARLK